MPKLNVVLMVVLSLAVSAGAAMLALSGKGPDPDDYKIALAMRHLGDHDPDIQRDAERDLTGLGVKAHPALQAAATGADRILAERARRLLQGMKTGSTAVAISHPPTKSEAAATPVNGALEFTLQLPKTTLAKGEPFRFYVRFTNGGRTPRILARHLMGTVPMYWEFASIEFIDAKGGVIEIPLDTWFAGKRAKNFVTVEAGASVDLYQENAEIPGDVLSKLSGSFQVRFVYEAGESSAYHRAIAFGHPQGEALPSGRLVSNSVAVTIE